jgi:hypothetical protein
MRIMVVPRGGLEPPCGYPRWILSPLRLPFRHLGMGVLCDADSGDRPKSLARNYIRVSEEILPERRRVSKRVESVPSSKSPRPR